MTTTSYSPPVDKLLAIGDAHDSMAHWPDYIALGLGPEHIPDLIRLAHAGATPRRGGGRAAHRPTAPG